VYFAARAKEQRDEAKLKQANDSVSQELDEKNSVHDLGTQHDNAPK
jgi:hypothetical protein